MNAFNFVAADVAAVVAIATACVVDELVVGADDVLVNDVLFLAVVADDLLLKLIVVADGVLIVGILFVDAAAVVIIIWWP